MIGSSSLAGLRQGDIIQLNRKGFWICDEAPNPLLGKPAVLFDVPDGHQRERSPLREADEVVVGTPESLEEARAAAANYHQQLKDTKKAKGDKDVIRDLKATEDEANAIVQLLEAALAAQEERAKTAGASKVCFVSVLALFTVIIASLVFHSCPTIDFWARCVHIESYRDSFRRIRDFSQMHTMT